ncbi:MAG: Spi family protease inhibitor, partial [Bacteroidales bacterium]|nr:Spi family protease inhibitor [Bacteroidales bacterium]
MKRFGILLFVIAVLAVNAFPETISTQKAAQVALRFISERFPSEKSGETAGMEIKETFIVTDQESPLYYIFNLEPDGWIAVSADDAVPPILAYSFEGRYDETNQAPQFTAWMKQYADQIRYAVRAKIAPFSQTETLWKELSDARSQMPDDQKTQIQDPASGIRHPASGIRHL